MRQCLGTGTGAGCAVVTARAAPVPLLGVGCGWLVSVAEPEPDKRGIAEHRCNANATNVAILAGVMAAGRGTKHTPWPGVRRMGYRMRGLWSVASSLLET